jgi:hypothetical protein
MNAIRDRIPTVSSLPFGDDTDNVDDEDPKDWDRKGRLGRLWAALSVYPFLTISVALFAMTLVLYLYPVLPSAHRNIGFVTIGGVLVAFAAWGLYNRILAIRGLSKYDLHVNYRGGAVSARLAKQTDIPDERIRGYKILREFRLGGLVTSFEAFRNRFSRREISDHKEKYHRAGDDGSGDIVDGVLEPQTAETATLRNDIELFRSIAVTHAGEQQPKLDSKNVDSVSTLPPTIDSRTSADVRSAFEKQSRDRDHARQQLQMLENYIKEMREYVDPAGQPLLENVIGTIETLNEIDREDDDGQDIVLNPSTRDNNGRDNR